MGLFKTEAKARRKEELEEQHKKKTAAPSEYSHSPTHALKDSLQCVPDANWGTDEKRLREAHRQRLERETSALAAGSDTNATNIPANYWQGRPLPAQFKAPKPAGLRKLAKSRAALRGNKVALPDTLPTKQQSQKPVDDEGYASGHELNSTAKRSRKLKGLANGPSRQSVIAQPQKDEAVEAAEASKEAELERLRNRVKELEAERIGQQYERVDLVDRPAVLTRAPANNASSPKPTAGVAESQSAVPQVVGPIVGIQSGTSSSSRWGSQSSEKSSGKDIQKKDESTPPTTPPPSRDSDGVARYDWAMHWIRRAARTDEERDKLPPAVNPQQRLAPDKAPQAEADPQPYDSFGPNFSRRLSASRRPSASPRPEPSSSSSGHQSARTSEGLAGYVADGETKAKHVPTASEIDELNFWC